MLDIAEIRKSSFNYGIVPAATTNNHNGMVNSGLSVSFIEYLNPRTRISYYFEPKPK